MSFQDRATGERVATCCETLNTIELSEEARRVGNLYNHAVLGVERNAIGTSIIDNLAAMDYDNLYWAEDGKAGWYTGGVTRPVMLNALRQEVSEAVATGDYGRFKDRRLIEQMQRFRKARGPGDKPQAGEGAHDDLVFADAICSQVRVRAQSGGGAVF
jgi:hypothetical protein